MAKLRTEPISQKDVAEFIKCQSDFAFELHVLNALVNRGFTCEHGGTYTDPSTQKLREFDIRAVKDFGQRFLRLAVECKNVAANAPILISCMPRRGEEDFSEIVASWNPDKLFDGKDQAMPGILRQMSWSAKLVGEHSLYKPHEPVGKNCDQVARFAGDGSFMNSDKAIYEKWAQSIASAHDLTGLAGRDGRDRTGTVAMTVIVPLLVVPDGRLWTVRYSEDGSQVEEPRPTDRCSYFVGVDYWQRGDHQIAPTTISHLEFVTVRGLANFVDEVFGLHQINARFPAEHLATLPGNPF
jgi:hypothetical protein